MSDICHLNTSLYKCINLPEYRHCITAKHSLPSSSIGTMNYPPTFEDRNKLYTSRRRVIACATVIEEMLPLLPADVPYEVLDFGLHINPQELKRVLQEKVDEASPNADVLLL